MGEPVTILTTKDDASDILTKAFDPDFRQQLQEAYPTRDVIRLVYEAWPNVLMTGFIYLRERQ